MAETTLRIVGMTCEHCRESVTRALQAVPGVQEAAVDLAAGTARVVYDGGRTDGDALARAVENTGYQLEGRSAPAGGHKGCRC